MRFHHHLLLATCVLVAAAQVAVASGKVGKAGAVNVNKPKGGSPGTGGNSLAPLPSIEHIGSNSGDDDDDDDDDVSGNGATPRIKATNKATKTKGKGKFKVKKAGRVAKPRQRVKKSNKFVCFLQNVFGKAPVVTIPLEDNTNKIQMNDLMDSSESGSQSCPIINLKAAPRRNGPNISQSKQNAPLVDELKTFTLEDFTKLKKVGDQGACGEVRLGTVKDTQDRVAVKVAGESNMDRKMMATEVETLKKLRHPNILQLIGEVVDNAGEVVGFAAERLDGGTLLDMVNDQFVDTGRYIEENLLLDIFAPIIDAVAYMHEQGIAHNDIKPANVMLRKSLVNDNDLEFTPILIDFGTASAKADKKACGTPEYTEPIVAKGKGGYTAETGDVYALGGTIINTVTEWHPGQGDVFVALDSPFAKKGMELLVAAGKGDGRTPYSKEFIALMKGMLNVDPKQRWKMDKVRNEWTKHRVARGLD